MNWRKSIIVAGFGLLGATQLHRIVAPATRGRGVILTFHHVRPTLDEAFAPNALLAVTPGFLADVIVRLRRLGYDIVSMDEAARRLADEGPSDRRFAVLTFDDGFRDNRDHALPVLARLEAPATFYVTTGYAERTGRLWWVELEEAIRRTDTVDIDIDGQKLHLDVGSPKNKQAAFDTIYWRLRQGSEERLLDVIGRLADAQGVSSAGLVDALCLDWAGIADLARHPLMTIGAHTLSHPMLAKHEDDMVRRELRQAKAELEARLDRPVRHVAYPVGDPTSAGPREFKLAAEAGYTTGVTTRPGLLFPQHQERLLALPRVSMNGRHQTLRDLDILLSGLALTLWNKGRRVAPLER